MGIFWGAGMLRGSMLEYLDSGGVDGACVDTMLCGWDCWCRLLDCWASGRVRQIGNNEDEGNNQLGHHFVELLEVALDAVLILWRWCQVMFKVMNVCCCGGGGILMGDAPGGWA